MNGYGQGGGGMEEGKERFRKAVEEKGGAGGLVKKCNFQRQSLLADGSLSEVGIIPPHN